MVQDRKGFLYPKVNIGNCIECGLCEKTCPVIHEGYERKPEHVYAIKTKDEKIRLSSSSGGVFSFLAEQVLKEGGVVFGAAFDEQWNVRHVCITNADDLEKLRGSKYVQSNIGNTFSETKKFLQEGIPVLFSGTPCQIAGLKLFLKKEYGNLTTVDFVCHGVPNPRIWQEYLKEEAAHFLNSLGYKTYPSSLDPMSLIKSISFRDKPNGWKQFHFSIELSITSEDGKENSILSSRDVWEHPYMLLFLKDYILRPSCHHCHFRCGKGMADYTMADYWGIERFYPDFFDDHGVSLFMTYKNSRDVFLHSNSLIDYIETSYQEACVGNYAIRHDWPVNKDSVFFYLIHDMMGLSIQNSLVLVLKISSLRRLVVATMSRTKSKVKRILKK